MHAAPSKATLIDAGNFEALLNTHLPNLMLDKRNIQEQSPPVSFAVGVSGGPDSLLLAWLLKDICCKHKVPLLGLIVDHGLRPESGQEALWTKKQLQQFAIESEILPLRLRKVETRLQERARQERHQILKTTCFAKGISHLFLAHHKDDQAETFMMRLCKKSSLLGLGGMRILTQTPQVQIIRPLLSLSKADILKTLEHHHLSFIKDPSNEKVQFERVRFRQKKATSVFSPHRQKSLEGVRDALENWVSRFLKAHARLDDFGTLSLRSAAFRLLPEFYQETLLHYIFRSLGVGRYPPSRHNLNHLLKTLKKDPFKITLQGLIFEKRKDNYLFYRSREHLPPPLLRVQIQESIAQERLTIFWDQRFLVTCKSVLAHMTDAKDFVSPVAEKDQQHAKKMLEKTSMSFIKTPIMTIPALYHGQEMKALLPLLAPLKSPDLPFLFQKEKKSALFTSKSPFRAFFFENHPRE